MTGYESSIGPNPIIINGKKVSTVNWNPFIFALVLSKADLFKFIAKDNNSFNIR
jgi:hypothetical protein